MDLPYNISSKGRKANSISTFSEMDLSQVLVENLEQIGYKEPTPIQRHATPQLLLGCDVMACGQTGSGKTAAYLLPIIDNLVKNSCELDHNSCMPYKPLALVLVPTRELALQISREARLYCENTPIRTSVCYGGVACFKQKEDFKGGCNIVAATPGRLQQFLEEDVLSLERVKFLILDEADKMLDLGFMADIKMLVDQVPNIDVRVTGMFSATFPVGIQKAAAAFLKMDYVYVVIGMLGGASSDIVQEFISVETNEKRHTVLKVLKEEEQEKILIFCNEKRTVDELTTYLNHRQISALCIHGDIIQKDRELAIKQFSQGDASILVASAVVARGLDIPKVSLVVNYDLPDDINEYVQRIGRTGRLGHTGKSISLYDASEDYELSPLLTSVLRNANQPVPNFLEEEGGGYYGSEEADCRFASTDIRNRVPRYGMPEPVHEGFENDWEG